MSHRAIIRRKISLMSTSVDEAFARFWAAAEEPWVYPAYLLFSHQLVRAAVPLMEAALAESKRLALRDPVCAELATYLEHHVEEEQGHDLWLLADLADLGRTREEVLARIPSPKVASLVGAHYYWIHHHHPVALLGYIAFLEDCPPSPEFIAELQARTRAPRSAFRFLRGHAKADPGHRADLDRLLDRLPLLAMHHEAIGLSLVHTIGGVADCVNHLAAPRAAAAGAR